MFIEGTFSNYHFESYTKYELSNFRGCLVQAPSKPDLSGCALPYICNIQPHDCSFID